VGLRNETAQIELGHGWYLLVTGFDGGLVGYGAMTGSAGGVLSC
jgi:hypothetical protein